MKINKTVYACKRNCEKCFNCNGTGGGFIDCFYGIYIDPTTAPHIPMQTNFDNFHKCNSFIAVGDSMV